MSTSEIFIYLFIYVSSLHKPQLEEVLRVSAYCTFRRWYYVIQMSINYRAPIWLAYNISLFQSWLDYRDLRMVEKIIAWVVEEPQVIRDLDFDETQYLTNFVASG